MISQISDDMARFKFNPNAAYNDLKLLGLRKVLETLAHWLTNKVPVDKRSWPGGRPECTAAEVDYDGLMRCEDLPGEITRLANRDDILPAWKPTMKKLCDDKPWKELTSLLDELPTGRADKPEFAIERRKLLAYLISCAKQGHQVDRAAYDKLTENGFKLIDTVIHDSDPRRCMHNLLKKEPVPDSWRDVRNQLLRLLEDNVLEDNVLTQASDLVKKLPLLVGETDMQPTGSAHSGRKRTRSGHLTCSGRKRTRSGHLTCSGRTRSSS